VADIDATFYSHSLLLHQGVLHRAGHREYFAFPFSLVGLGYLVWPAETS
jgi:hypothetical protein